MGMTRYSRTIVGTMLAAALFSRGGDAAAQTSAPDAQNAGINGLVITRLGRVPIEGAVVTLLEARRSATSTSAGAYQILGVPPGNYALSVRKIGFDPINVRITLQAGQVIDADIELEPARVQRLEEVTVRADSTLHGPMLQIAARMRYNAGGVFMLRAELDSARGRPVSDLLRKRARGAHMVNWSARGAILLATARGMASIVKNPQAEPGNPSSPTACFCQVYLDGIRIYSPTGQSPAPDLSQYDAGTLEAVEYYPGPATTPLEYGGDGASCGTLLLWTRAH
jgi:hypothetical protein